MDGKTLKRRLREVEGVRQREDEDGLEGSMPLEEDGIALEDGTDEDEEEVGVVVEKDIRVTRLMVHPIKVRSTTSTMLPSPR